MTKEELDEIKATMCSDYCLYLQRANKVELTCPDDLDQLTNMMHDVCANCPLNKL